MRFLIVLSLTLYCSILLAQNSEPIESINKGTRFIGGSFGFSSTKTEDSFHYTSISIGPGMAFYINDNLAVGGFISYNYDKHEQLNVNSTSTFSGAGLNVFLLKNYKLVNNVFFTLQPQLSLSSAKQDYSTPQPNDYSVFNFGLGISPGVMFFISKKFALQTSIGGVSYSYNRRKPENGGNSTSTNSFSLNGAFSMSNFAIRYFLW